MSFEMTHSVRFEEVTKRYRRGGPSYSSLRSDLRQAFRQLGRRLKGTVAQPRGTLALEDVSFDVQPGESFAILGPNGAGKTTALKIISRITYPTKGRVRVRGRVGALIEVGSGLHPELSGRENISLYGQILGMSKVDVRARFDEIVDFSEVKDFLDTPVKLYSSGMQLRLGFAIASHLDPEVFVVDEALAVGDAGFQAKCVERMSKLVSEGRSVIFVSHSLSAIETLCQRGVFLLNGKIQALDDVHEVLRQYLDWVDIEHQRRTEFAAPSSKKIWLDRLSCHDRSGTEQNVFMTGDDIEIRVTFRSDYPIDRPHISIGVGDGRPGMLAVCSTVFDGVVPDRIEGSTTVRCRLISVPLLPRVYEIWSSVRTDKGFGDLLDWQPIGSFRIGNDQSARGPGQARFWRGPLNLSHEWTFEYGQGQA